MKLSSFKLIGMCGALLISVPVLAEQPKMPADHMVNMGQATAPRIHGKVVETIDASSYTYVQIDSGGELHWAAGPKVALQKGSMIAIETNMPFKDFESRELKRKFKTVYFVNRFITDKADQAAAPSDPHAGFKMKSEEDLDVSGIKKVKGGNTVSEIFAQKQALKGKEVQVRGMVVKYSAKVMGKNWLHIKDGSGSLKLVITTQQDVKVGDVVLVKGVLDVDKDLGYGYIYEAIIEDASIKIE